MMSSSILLPVISLAFLPVLILFIYVRNLRVLKQLGAVRESFSHKIRYQFVGVLLIAPILIALLFIRKFDFLTSFAICGTGLIGFYIAVHDISCSKRCGVYEKGLVWNGSWVFFSNIDTWERVDPLTITLVMNDRTIKHLSFLEEEPLNRLETFLPSE